MLFREGGNLADFDAAIRLAPNNPYFYFGRGDAFGDHRRWDEAFADFDRAIQVNPKLRKEFYEHRGYVKWMKNDLAGAIDEITSALEISADNPDLLNRRALLKLWNRDLDGALADCDVGLISRPDDLNLIETRIDVLIEQDKFETALNDLNKAIEFEAATKFLARRGKVNRNLKNFDESIKDFSNAIKLNPLEPLYFVERAITWSAKKAFDEAMDDCDKAIAMNPEFRTAYACKGHILRMFEKLDEAMIELNRSLALDEKNPVALTGRALVWYAKEEMEHCEQDLRRALEADNKYVDALVLIGFLHAFQSQDKQAVESLNEAVQIKPDHGFAVLLLSSLLATSPDDEIRDNARAIELAKHLVKLQGNREYTAHLVLAIAHAKDGNYELATQSLERAEEIVPKNESNAMLRIAETIRRKQTFRIKLSFSPTEERYTIRLQDLDKPNSCVIKE
jgi:tetratricopeptide (TPR) repeat protein